MADPCNCLPYSNIECISANALTLLQPTCQKVPGMDALQANPFYDITTNITYYTYSIMLGCTSQIGIVEEFYITICDNIPLLDILNVQQKLDTCQAYTDIEYDFTNNSGQVPPQGSRFLRMLIDGDLGEGGCGLYRIAIAGNAPKRFNRPPHPGIALIITSLTSAAYSPFDLLFIGCSINPRLNVVKTCKTIYSDNQAVLSYNVTVGNANEDPVTDVMFQDTVTYDNTAITLGEMIVSDPQLTVDASVPGRIRIEGNLGTIPSGEGMVLHYAVPIMGVITPGRYIIANMAMATSGFIQGMSQCETTLEAVQLMTVNENSDLGSSANQLNFGLSYTGGSLEVATVVENLFQIPRGVELRFSEFRECRATFEDTQQLVPLNTLVPGPRNIQLRATIDVAPGSTSLCQVFYSIDSVSFFGETPMNIVNTLQDVQITSTAPMIKDIRPLPNEISIRVRGFILPDPGGMEEGSSGEGGMS